MHERPVVYHFYKNKNEKKTQIHELLQNEIKMTFKSTENSDQPDHTPVSILNV